MRRGERGQSYMEFAVMLPMLMLLIMGVVDFGRVFNAWLAITHGAREGARVAAVGYSVPTVQARVISATPGYSPTVSVAPTPAVGNPITVTATTTVTLLSSWIAGFVGSDGLVPVRGVGVMRYEGSCILC